MVNNQKMVFDVIEKYFIDVENQTIWEWLGITQVTWSSQKTNGISKKNTEKLKKKFFLKEFIDKKTIEVILEKYYNVIKIT